LQEKKKKNLLEGEKKIFYFFSKPKGIYLLKKKVPIIINIRIFK
jgi:hypothetical protein